MCYHICHLGFRVIDYLGVWARVKRRLWRLMLRFISSFLKSSGEFRGDPRGESLGEIFGDPPGEPTLDRGMSWMMGSLDTLCSCGLSSTSACSSSELSEHSSLMVNRGQSGVRKLVPLLALPLVTLVRGAVFDLFLSGFQINFIRLFRDMTYGSGPLVPVVEASASGPIFASSCLDKTWACSLLRQNSPVKTLK